MQLKWMGVFASGGPWQVPSPDVKRVIVFTLVNICCTFVRTTCGCVHGGGEGGAWVHESVLGVACEQIVFTCVHHHPCIPTCIHAHMHTWMGRCRLPEVSVCIRKRGVWAHAEPYQRAQISACLSHSHTSQWAENSLPTPPALDPPPTNPPSSVARLPLPRFACKRHQDQARHVACSEACT